VRLKTFKHCRKGGKECDADRRKEGRGTENQVRAGEHYRRDSQLKKKSGVQPEKKLHEALKYTPRGTEGHQLPSKRRPRVLQGMIGKNTGENTADSGMWECD